MTLRRGKVSARSLLQVTVLLAVTCGLAVQPSLGATKKTTTTKNQPAPQTKASNSLAIVYNGTESVPDSDQVLPDLQSVVAYGASKGVRVELIRLPDTDTESLLRESLLRNAVRNQNAVLPKVPFPEVTAATVLLPVASLPEPFTAKRWSTLKVYFPGKKIVLAPVVAPTPTDVITLPTVTPLPAKLQTGRSFFFEMIRDLVPPSAPVGVVPFLSCQDGATSLADATAAGLNAVCLDQPAPGRSETLDAYLARSVTPKNLAAVYAPLLSVQVKESHELTGSEPVLIAFSNDSSDIRFGKQPLMVLQARAVIDQLATGKAMPERISIPNDVVQARITFSARFTQPQRAAVQGTVARWPDASRFEVK